MKKQASSVKMPSVAGVRCNVLGILCAGLAVWHASQMPVVAAGLTNDDLCVAYSNYLKTAKGILDIRTIHKTGEGANHVDIVVVSAGFTADQMGEFHKVCERFAKSLLSGDAWSRYRNLINIHAVFVGDESVDSSRLHVHGYKGNILGCDNGKAVDYARCAANAAATLVIHNSGFSTASAGVWGVEVLNKGNADSSMTMVHELGHGFAGLGDEYIQIGEPYNGDAKDLEEVTVNVTAHENPRLCKWHYWVDDEWPGLFGPLKLRKGTKVANCEGAGWVKGIYRPEEGCIMRCNRDTFCAVCNEAMEANFFRYIDLFQKVEPSVGDIVLWKGENLDFRVSAVDMLHQPPEWLKSSLSFYLDGEQVAVSNRGEVSFQFRSAMAGPGVHQLGANLNVQSDDVRRDFGFMSGSRSWRVTVLPVKKPEIVLPPLVTVSADGTIDVPIKVKHAKPAHFNLTMTHAPQGAVLEKGRFKWKPAGQAGSWKVDFSALDEERHGVTESMEILVKRADKVNPAVEVASPDPVVAVMGKPVMVQLKAGSKDTGHLLYEPVQVLEGVQLNRETGELTWIPRLKQAKPERMRFRVKNGTASRDVDVSFWVRWEATPSPVSYCNQYRPQMMALLDQLRQNPIVYHRLFETLRLMRDRYAPIHQKALVEAKGMFPTLDPKLRKTCLEELRLHAWEFANKPEVLKWMREIAAGEKCEQAVILVKRLDQIDHYNVERVRLAAEEDVRRAAERVEALAGVVTTWQVSGVYAEAGKNSRDLVGMVFPPETASASNVVWTVAETFSDGILNISKALDKAKVKGPRDSCAAYLRATLDVPADTEARLEIGSDDGVKVWINGKEVFSNPVERALVFGQDKVNVHLGKGVSTLLVKITQGGSGWESHVRVRAKDGTAIPGLKIGLPR